MAPAVLLEYTKQKQRMSSQDISHSKMDKPQKLSRRHPPSSAMDAERGPNVMLDSECSGRAVRAVSVDLTLPNSEKCINLSADRFNDHSIPVRVIRLPRTSHSQRKELKIRLKSELEQVKMIQVKLFSRNMITAGGTNSSSLNEIGENCNSLKQGGSHTQRGKSVLSESSKRVAPQSASNSILLLMKQCEALLKRLMMHKHGWIFNNPVDVVELNIPDYYTVIKHPMDLGTIKSKIASGCYSTPLDFAADVRLTFTNAMTYNPPNNTVHIMADTLIKFFEARWKPIEKKIASVDASAKNETQVPKSEFSGLKKPVISNVDYKLPVPERINAKMTDAEKQSLTSCLVSVLADLPNHIIEFLRKHSGNMNQNSDEIEIDIESLGDDTLFELRKLLDDYLQERESRQQLNADQSTLKVFENGVSTSPLHSCKGNDFAEEDVDICGDDSPSSMLPGLSIEKVMKARHNRGSSSSSASSSSSDSDGSTGSESKEQISLPKNVGKKESSTNKDYKRNDVLDPPDKSRPLCGLNQSEMDAHLKPSLAESDERQEGEHAPSERQRSPEKLYRTAFLLNRFADTILKAQEKTLGQGEKGDPEKLQQQREEIERQQREVRARLQAEAKAAEDAQRRAELEAAAEAKRKIDLEREAARQALLKMEKTVDINEDSGILKDLEMLRAVQAEELPAFIDDKNQDGTLDGAGDFKLVGGNPLEQLGLFIKVDEEEDEESVSS